MRFSITNWRAVSPYHHSLSDWRNFLRQGSIIANETPQSPDLSFLPAMKRRRLSPLARLMFSAAWPLVEEGKNCPLIFVSHDGEVNRSLDLWQSLLHEDEVSPTSFALSVHNAVAGQWSLMRQDMSESVALSARTNGLEIAIVEACGMLAAGHPEVLVVIADEPLRGQYDIPAERAPFEYALALLITSGDTWELLYQADELLHSQSSLVLAATPVDCVSKSSSSHYYSSALNWIEQQISSDPNEACCWNELTADGVWQWARGAL